MTEVRNTSADEVQCGIAARHPNQSVPTNPEQQDAAGVDEQDRHDASGVDVTHRIHDLDQSALGATARGPPTRQQR